MSMMARLSGGEPWGPLFGRAEIEVGIEQFAVAF